ncbi:hypothetical protein [Falsiroseomonas sp.]|uniref:hypothetical protein n=1 Tax=Falsiroseomonas sp. TaxID=2870721 RepID=UPI002736CA9C|nr:hypothetical protein [Falsiroseomonas sp.]MDP3417666.1 hypothetical protein [Falsiroseomonas sp.]
MGLLLVTPATAAERAAIEAGEAWHFSKASPRQLTEAKLAGGPGQPNARIRLSAPSGWQLDFWKFIRDASVWDPAAFSPADRGRYLYLFLGEPGTWTRRMNVQKAPLTVRIPGALLLAAVPPANLFYRAVDKVVVVKGDYVGPALLDPPP